MFKHFNNPFRHNSHSSKTVKNNQAKVNTTASNDKATGNNQVKGNTTASNDTTASNNNLASNDTTASNNNAGTINGNSIRAEMKNSLMSDPKFRKDIDRTYSNSKNKRHFLHIGKENYQVNMNHPNINVIPQPSAAFRNKFLSNASMNHFLGNMDHCAKAAMGSKLLGSQLNNASIGNKNVYVANHPASKYVQMQNQIKDLKQKLQTVTRQRDEARQENKAKDGVNKSLKTLNNAYKEMHTSDQQTHRVDEQLHKSDQNKIKAQQKTINQDHSASVRPKSEEAKPESSTSASSSVRPRNFVRGYAPLHSSEGPFRPINQPSNNSNGPKSSGPRDGGPDL